MVKNGNDNKNLSMVLTRSIFIGKSLTILLLDYSIFDKWLVYNNKWDKTAEL